MTGTIFDAVANDSPEEIEKALDNGADINQKQAGSGQTPLMNAVLMGKVEAVKTLLKHKADTTIGEKDGYTPMHGAGFQGRAEIAQILIDHGMDPRDVHQDGYEPIVRACWGREKRHSDTVKRLLPYLDPQRDSRQGHTIEKQCVEKTPNEKTRKRVSKWLNKARGGNSEF